MIGPSYRFWYFNIFDTEEGGLIETGNLRGNDLNISSGIGFETVWDKRDHVFYPLKGFRIDGDFHYYPKWLGSDYEFSRFNLFASTFHNIYKKQVLAFNSELNLTSGSVPFQMLPKAGSQNNMRGIYEGRFMDNNHFSFQTEYRIPLFYRFGLNVFGGVANVSDEISRFRLNNFVPAYGVGIRFNIKKEDHLNLRLDIANSEDGVQFYFNIKEAF
jgi:outer membrane protein assembly factor BamA